MADKYHLGAVRSVHRQERPSIRRVSRQVWSLIGAVGIGALLAHLDTVAYNYSQVQILGMVAIAAGLYTAGFVVAGPFGASLFPTDGEARWIVLYERGLIDAREPTEEESDAEHDVDIVGKVIRLEQVVAIEEHGEVIPFADEENEEAEEAEEDDPDLGEVRIVADREGVRTTLLLDGFRRQDRLMADLLLRLLRMHAAAD